ncbi:MAG: flagellar hook-length control protein FliK [Synergistaceae bacterium]|nr:flagellar hook-length control protein FliK [Synergistaceae bacterium]
MMPDILTLLQAQTFTQLQTSGQNTSMQEGSTGEFPGAFDALMAEYAPPEGTPGQPAPSQPVEASSSQPMTFGRRGTFSASVMNILAGGNEEQQPSPQPQAMQAMPENETGSNLEGWRSLFTDARRTLTAPAPGNARKFTANNDFDDGVVAAEEHSAPNVETDTSPELPEEPSQPREEMPNVPQSEGHEAPSPASNEETTQPTEPETHEPEPGIAHDSPAAGHEDTGELPEAQETDGSNVQEVARKVTPEIRETVTPVISRPVNDGTKTLTDTQTASDTHGTENTADEPTQEAVSYTEFSPQAAFRVTPKIQEALNELTDALNGADTEPDESTAEIARPARKLVSLLSNYMAKSTEAATHTQATTPEAPRTTRETVRAEADTVEVRTPHTPEIPDDEPEARDTEEAATFPEFSRQVASQVSIQVTPEVHEAIDELNTALDDDDEEISQPARRLASLLNAYMALTPNTATEPAINTEGNTPEAPQTTREAVRVEADTVEVRTAHNPEIPGNEPEARDTEETDSFPEFSRQFVPEVVGYVATQASIQVTPEIQEAIDGLSAALNVADDAADRTAPELSQPARKLVSLLNAQIARAPGTAPEAEYTPQAPGAASQTEPQPGPQAAPEPAEVPSNDGTQTPPPAVAPEQPANEHEEDHTAAEPSGRDDAEPRISRHVPHEAVNDLDDDAPETQPVVPQAPEVPGNEARVYVPTDDDTPATTETATTTAPDVLAHEAPEPAPEAPYVPPSGEPVHEPEVRQEYIATDTEVMAGASAVQPPASEAVSVPQSSHSETPENEEPSRPVTVNAVNTEAPEHSQPQTSRAPSQRKARASTSTEDTEPEASSPENDRAPAQPARDTGTYTGSNEGNDGNDGNNGQDTSGGHDLTQGRTETRTAPSGTRNETRRVETRRTVSAPSTSAASPQRTAVHSDFQSFFEGVTRARRTASRTPAQPLSLRAGTYSPTQAGTLRAGIVNTVRFIRADGVQKANIVIDPPALGRITIELSSGTSGVEASVKVASEQIRQVVQEQMAQLRENLSQQGVQVSEFTVDVQQDNTGQGQNSGRENQRRQYEFSAGNTEEDTEDFRIDLEEGLLYWVA